MDSLAKVLTSYGYKRLGERRRLKERYWPSDAGKCLRAVVYQWRLNQKKLAETIGDKIHEFYEGKPYDKLNIKEML